MTTLPATIYEAFAADWIRQYSEPALGVLHPSYSFKSIMRRWVLHHPYGADEMVMFAEDYGSHEADQVLQEIIAERIDRDQSLGAVLGAYDIRSHNPVRNRKPGPNKFDNFRRDIGIASLVYALITEFGLAVHHNPASRPPSASTVAAAALAEAGIGIVISHRGVAKIWDRYGPLFMPGPLPEGYLGPFA